MTQLQKMHFAKATYLVNKDLGYFPYFQFILRTRLNKRKAVNVVVTGEAGEGKSYVAWTLCLLLDPKFSVKDIVYTYSDYMKLLRKPRMGRPIMFDEPSYAMGKRDWYKQINKVLVQTIESQRFKVHPLFIPVINKALLDKTIRDHLIQFQVIVKDRGKADVFRLQASQFEEKVYYHFLCQIRYPLIGQCPREYYETNRQSCLGCRQLKKCPTFRAQYERQKLSIQNKRYEQAEVEASYMETRDMTDKQLATMIYSLKDKILNSKGILSAKKLRIVFLHDLDIKIGHNRSYTIKELLKMMHPDEFT